MQCGFYGFQVGIWKTSSWLIWEQFELLRQASKNNYHHKGSTSRLSLCKVYASLREWFAQIPMSDKVVLSRMGNLPEDEGEDGASGKAVTIHCTSTCDGEFASAWVHTRCLPNASKRGSVVSYEKNSKCRRSLNSSLLSKATVYKNKGSLYIWQ